MNVVLNTDEANAVMSVVTGQLIDQAGLSEAAKKAIREWRRDLAPGTTPLDEFTLRLNEAIGNFIDERTTRMMRTRGQIKSVERR
ncbi:MAG: hypothetical protein DWG80_07200 [Chloroflexi bacterium]|nr:hypothetical protein [Chloroflexota bacterium]